MNIFGIYYQCVGIWNGTAAAFKRAPQGKSLLFLLKTLRKECRTSSGLVQESWQYGCFDYTTDTVVSRSELISVF